ncbi:hypothetical protein F965_02733 [Acinetobacter schindleri NIPH 900]|uniref:Steroid 5-alpha reductase C-terminal domain-containing protein n=1 Tax=Acinetobacter schindleri NIPH 900 TaxID=1217675 RepID=N8XYN8_9GAMM|nr:isoprenylcysteine carboxylmethyltransferase family protein [Acinetobacter schindleri]ENV12170.1 hypothetical protein F965_02733 [Acinetobacter schindleri NIPH 900]
MLKVSFSIITSIFVCLIINKAQLLTSNNSITIKFTIFTSLLIGVLIAYHSNKPNLTFYQHVNNKQRIKIKLFTFIIVWIFSILFSYFVYHQFQQPLYADYIFDSITFSPIILILFYSWIKFWDKRQENPNDDYIMWWSDFHISKLYFKKYKIFFLGNLVKIFFIPYIYGAVNLAMTQILSIESIFQSPWSLIKFLFFFGLCCDVMIALGGYIFSSKFLGTESTSVDETWQGWLVCLICYPPLLILYKFISQQTDHYIWTDWLQADSFLYWIWAFLICFTWCIYWLATASFGFKFSNLSWRGLVNTGLYKYMRHPAYFSKNVYWWLHTVPFFGVMGLDMLRNFLALSFVSLIYYLRAKTEEKHLLKFKEYQEYYTWIENNGLWAKIKKKFKKS